MTLTKEDLKAIAGMIEKMGSSIKEDLRQEMREMNTSLRNDMQEMNTSLRNDMREMNDRITNIELHLENVTDWNIRLIAENFIELTNKLNQAIPAAAKNLAFEVKVNYLAVEVERLKEAVAAIRDRIAS